MAALLSARGYTTLALAYFAMPGLPATLDRIPLEYFGSALQWFAGQPSVQAERLGVVGASRGGELALLLGASFRQLRCVVAYVPSGVTWGAYPSSGHSAWTLADQELAHAAPDEAQWEAAVAAGRAGPEEHGWYRFALQQSAVREQASIRVEQIQGPVPLISGMDDGLWPSTELADLAVQRAWREKFAHRMDHLAYPEAGHGIGWPGGPTTVTRFTHPVSVEALDCGGTPAGNARARRDSWARALDFLAQALQTTGA
ncbi:MAG: acyl-CoA thioester hydrolase/BAAT C-terminal domain-containing protein [Pseudomonadota bacterium]|nr:acyl-CoA thioester hydrolase/BAAT C-terminal domain-containing protein [Pseudomonadota bacterium]